MRYQKKRSGYVGQLTKTINKIEQCFSKNNFSKLEEYGNSLDEIIVKVRNATTQLNKLVTKDRIEPEEVLNLCSEQEVRVINIRKTISAISLPEMTQLPHQELFCPVKSVVLDVEENEISKTLIQSSHPNPLINKHQKEKGLNFENEFTQKSFYTNLNTSQLYHEIMRAKVSSIHSKSSSSKSASSQRSSKIESSSN